MTTKPLDLPEAMDVCHFDRARCVMLWSEAPALASCDQLAPRFPVLAFFVRLLAVRFPCMAEAAAEQLSLYAMGWHCEDPPRDSTIDYAEFAAEAMDDTGADRLFEFECHFTLHLRHDPALEAHYKHRPGAVVLDV